MKFYSYEKKGGGVSGKVLAMLKVGGSFGVVFTRKIDVLAVLKSGGGGIQPLNGGGGRHKICYPVKRGGGKVSDPRFCPPPPTPHN